MWPIMVFTCNITATKKMTCKGFSFLYIYISCSSCTRFRNNDAEGLGFRVGFSLEDEVNIHKSLCIWCYHLEKYCCKCLSTFERESENRSISWPANLISLTITLFTQIATQKLKSIIPCSLKIDTLAALKHLSLHARSTMLKPTPTGLITAKNRENWLLVTSEMVEFER